MRQMLRKFLCNWGFHEYEGVCILVSLDHYWVSGGRKCKHCDVGDVDIDEARRLIKSAYARGQERENVRFLAYGRGIQEIVRLYGKEQVIRAVNEGGEIRVTYEN